MCYWLVKCGVLHVLCACETGSHSHLSTSAILIAACVCVCVCVRERETRHSGVYCLSEIVLNRGLFVNTYEHHHVSVTRFCSPLRLELMVKLRTLLTVFNFESWRSQLWKALHFQRGLWCSANHNALCQFGNQSRLRLSERRGFVENK